MSTKTIRDLTPAELHGKRALVRVDFNVPLDEAGQVADDTRITAALPTINTLLDGGASVVLLAHFGRPKGAPEAKYSLAPVAARLEALLPRPVHFLDVTVGERAVDATRTLAAGEVLLLENTRFLPGEEKNDEALARQLAQLGDFYVNDAFGAAHRAHASTAGVAKFCRPAVAGLLMEKELAYLGGALADPQRPFVAILGGSKISGKIDVVEALLPKVDKLLIGGAMACTFFKAMGFETGNSLVEPDRLDMAKDLLARAGDKLVLPVDATIAPAMDAATQATAVPREAIPAGQAMFDIGPVSVTQYRALVESAKTVLWNGPMGVFEKPPFDAGTRGVAEAMAKATANGATTIIGGGDSAAAVAEAGLEAQMSHVSTGGGASLEFLEGKDLPGVSALDGR
ncbi:phosphoglycerate kinase [Gemmatimonas sp.]|uniref:phosphoglycerate kinase n=1 Tax=Gemmatimonas sp. TaxID=1962908 RepID=UPI0027B96D33|nr:phosphoglycerate kinase [Gemmatimonas sp.]